MLTNVLVLPIYSYYKNEEHNVIALLSYMNTKEIRKAIQRLRQVK